MSEARHLKDGDLIWICYRSDFNLLSLRVVCCLSRCTLTWKTRLFHVCQAIRYERSETLAAGTTGLAQTYNLQGGEGQEYERMSRVDCSCERSNLTPPV